MDTCSDQLELVPRTIQPALPACEIAAWLDGGYVHTTGRCPGVHHGTEHQLHLPVWATCKPCPVCGPFANTYRVTGPDTAATGIRLAIALHEVGHWVSAAEHGDIVALANAGVAITQAAQADLDLDRDGHRFAALATILDAHRRTLRLLRARHRHTLNIEVVRRWLVGADGPGSDQPDDAEQRHVWRAVRWAVRCGADNTAPAREHPWVSAWLAALDDHAHTLADEPTHFLIAIPSGTTRGERIALLAAAGLLDGGPHTPGAAWVPEGLARALAPGQPGVTVMDAGQDARCDDTLLPVFFGLWEPGGSGPLGVPAGALDAAQHLAG